MRFLLVISIFVLLTVACGTANAGALTQDPVVYCPPGTCAIDGNLNEIAWQVPPAVMKFMNTSGRSAKEPTQAWASYGKEGIYFAFACDQAKMSPKNSANNKNIWQDDSVEVFIDTDCDRKSYDHFILNAAGAKYQERVDSSGNINRDVALDWKGAIKAESGRWYAEIFIPYSSLGIKYSEVPMIRTNFCRNNPVQNEQTCWTEVDGSFNDPLRFGYIVLGVPPHNFEVSADTSTESLLTGVNKIRLNCENNSKSAVNVVVTAYPSGKQISSDKPITVAAGKSLDTTLNVDFNQSGRSALRVALIDQATGARTTEYGFTGVAVTPVLSAVGGVITSGDWGTLWNSTGTYKVMQETKLPSEKAQGVRISAAKNEFEPFQLVLKPAKQLKNVKVTPHILTGPKGAKIEAWNVSVRNVDYIFVSEPTSLDVAKGYYPDALPEFAPFTATQGVNNPVWVTVYVPSKTVAGDYKGTVDVSADGLKTISVPVTVHVWNFELPNVSKLRTAFGCGLDGPVSYQGATTTEEMRKLAELYYRDFWRHRVAPYNPYAFYDIKTSVENGKLKLDFSDFDQAIDKFFPLFNSFNLPHFGVNDDAGLNAGADSQRLKIDYMREVTEHLVNKGQIGKAYNYIFDEPTPEQYASVKDASELCRQADSRIKVLLTEQPEKNLTGAVDIWVPIIDSYDEAAAKERQAAGEQVWWYVCCGPHHPYPNNFIDYPAVEQRILPWISWNYGVNGILYWQTTYWRDNPYDTSMSYTTDGKVKWGNGDGRLLYPAVKTPSSTFVAKGPVPSIRWEMIREGIEDYDYFAILKAKVDDLKKSGKTSAALTKADNALNAIGACAKSRTEFTRDPRKLDEVRATVAEAIEALN